MNHDFKANFSQASKPPSKRSSEMLTPSKLEILVYKPINETPTIPTLNPKFKKSRSSFMRFFYLFWTHFCNFMTKRKKSKHKTIDSCISEIIHTNMEHHRISNKFVRFIRILMIVQKAIKFLQWKTKFRKMRNFNEKDKNLIEGFLSTEKIEIKNSKIFTFIKNKRVRASVRYMRHFSRKKLKGCLKCLSIIFLLL